MRCAHITPPAWAGSFPLGNYRMALAQWIPGNPMYVKNMKSDSAYVILDNGAFEGKRQTDSQLMLAAQRIGADEMVLPDVPGDAKATLDLASTSYKKLYGSRMMFVPHGQSLLEWKTCLDRWMHIVRDGYHVIGISPMRYLEGGYRHTLEMLEFTHGYNVPIHLLGLADASYFVRALLDAAREYGVRGIDTSYAFALGAQGKLLTTSAKKVDLGSIHQYGLLSSSTRRLITLNMAILDDWMVTTPGAIGVSASVIRKTASKWLKYWEEGYQTIEACIAACGLSGEFVQADDDGISRYREDRDLRADERLISI